jgi:hypothetical protein
VTIDSRSLGVDPDTGIEEILHFDADSGDLLHLEHRQDVEAMVERSVAEAIDAPSGWKGDWHKVASIPNVVLMELEKQGILNDPPRFKKWLNDRDNRFFRTREGHL